MKTLTSESRGEKTCNRCNETKPLSAFFKGKGGKCVPCNFAEGLLKTPRRAFLLYQYMTKNELFYGTNA
jgi:hypothetical protein